MVDLDKKGDIINATATIKMNELSLLSEQMTTANVTAEQHSKYSDRKHG